MGYFIRYAEYEIDRERRENAIRQAEQYRLAAMLQSEHPWRIRKWIVAARQFVQQLALRAIFGISPHEAYSRKSHPHYRRRHT
jgi:hypothetical protein